MATVHSYRLPRNVRCCFLPRRVVYVLVPLEYLLGCRILTVLNIPPQPLWTCIFDFPVPSAP